jgi:hypothetical protein
MYRIVVPPWGLRLRWYSDEYKSESGRRTSVFLARS